jgi:flagellar biosynthesis/type III secretory pathway protein FliH
VDSSRFGQRTGRLVLGSAPQRAVLEPIAFEPPKLRGGSTGRAGRPRDDERSLAQAREEGRAEALAEIAPVVDAHQRATAHMERAASALAQALDQIERADLEMLHHFERQVLALGVSLAEEIVGRELRSFSDVAVASAERALRMAPERGDLVLRVNPADLAAVLDSAAVMGRRGGEVQVVPDADVAAGGCIAQCGPLQIDAQLPAVFARLREAFES